MEDIKDLWLKYNEYSNKLAAVLGRTSNIVGEYAEHLTHKHYGGKLQGISEASSDIEAADGKLYQVKSRKIDGTGSTQLGVIRSWEFDFLIVVLFQVNGDLQKVLEVPVIVAKEYGVRNDHQNGWIITTNQKFKGDIRSKDMTLIFSQLK